MSENDERTRRLREEVNQLREQLTRLAERLEEPPVEDEPTEEAPEEEAPAEDEEAPTETRGPDEEDDWRGEDWPERDRMKPWKKIKIKRRGADSWDRVGDYFGDRLGDYIGGFIDDVMEGVASEVESSLFIGPRPVRDRPPMMSDDEVKRTAVVMSALGNEHRINILKELSWGGLYASDLQDMLKEISPSTLSSHLDVLQDVGLITQERRRGRYLITMDGRLAIKMAASIAKRVDIDDSPGPDDLD